MNDQLADENARLDVALAARYDECHEEVARKGELQPCEGIAVGVRIDRNEGGFYPVCSRHTRAPMVRLSDLRTALRFRAAESEEDR